MDYEQKKNELLILNSELKESEKNNDGKNKKKIHKINQNKEIV